MFDIKIGDVGVFDIGQLNLTVASLPEGEQRRAVLLFGNVVFLHKHVDAFASAVALIDWIEQNKKPLSDDDNPSIRMRNINCLVNWVEKGGPRLCDDSVSL